MKTLILTKGRTALVDDDDFESLSKWKWSLSETGGGYAVRNQKGKMILMHRQIMEAPDGFVVDHINGNSTDNRRTNLRICTQVENTHNSKGHKDSISGLKGVSYYKGHVNKKWRASIHMAGERTNLGFFHTKEEAHEAYRVAAARMHGTFLHGSQR